MSMYEHLSRKALYIIGIVCTGFLLAFVFVGRWRLAETLSWRLDEAEVVTIVSIVEVRLAACVVSALFASHFLTAVWYLRTDTETH